MPWRVIDGPETADAFAAEIAARAATAAPRAPRSPARCCSRMPLFEGSGYRGMRRVIDVSGDGANNNGPPVTLARDEVLAKGITINGLPIMLKRPNAWHAGYRTTRHLLRGLRDRRAGRVRHSDQEREQFKEAIRTKLVLEIAGRTPERRDRAGGERQAPHLLHHRRATVAGALGQLRFDPLGREARHRRTWRSDGRLRFARRRPAAIRWGITVRVLIVGGGIAGMALAIGLRRAGIAAEIVEIDKDWRVYGAGITITGPTLRALDRLGLLDASWTRAIATTRRGFATRRAMSSWRRASAASRLGRAFRTAAASCGRCCTGSCPRPRAHPARRCGSASGVARLDAV